MPSSGPPANDGRASSHARAAKARMEQERRRRQRMLIAGVASVAVVAVVIVLVAVKLSSSSKNSNSATSVSSNAPTDLAPGDVVTTLSDIPASQLAQAAATKVAVAPNPISGPPALTSGNLPEIVYVGAEYCPYCAAERWAVVTALSKFGTFAGLGQTTSSSQDVDPSTVTFSFHGSSYTSQYLVFSPVEELSNVVDGDSYAPLDKPTAQQESLVESYDKAPYTGGSSGSSGGIPFIDLGGKFIVSGASYDPAVLQGKTMDQIATAAADPSTKIGQSIESAAGELVADVCQLTKDQPSNVCSASNGT
jgi:hypothetical protein